MGRGASNDVPHAGGPRAVPGGLRAVPGGPRAALKGLSENKSDNSKIEKEVKKEIIDLCATFPIYDV